MTIKICNQKFAPKGQQFKVVINRLISAYNRVTPDPYRNQAVDLSTLRFRPGF